ncbi:type II toxin-antitoxin system VapC family toxin [Catenulispora sp. NF23]|uniref:Type II toxin-antitoxin system VapC family toxin n=1 Tax=Catenulispora pinistramenti TaxID=2705254 RepID=A0ABS5KIM8_9ACTN|nr:type II toxin-antitoxin system VapC family toxin [Catenulispora pinistramenti]MBS2531254.1 type II toxin-antitoxin system VapC family toxin [Catenulispora pinistramenti]MBS2545932.1 type II toxin-antitoxin system VapC family toxin [Catenulispora pinistramenti]
MPQAVVMDTDVASASFKRKPLPLLVKLATMDPVITFVTFGELVKWTVRRHWARHNRVAMDNWLAGMPVLDSTEAIARTWGALAAAADDRGRPRPQNDMWIAAACLTYGIPLATLNLKDYLDFEAHHGLQLVRV